MIGYASRTGSTRNLRALRRAGWRLLVSAAGVWRNEGMRYAIDNGAWTAFQQGVAFDEDAFEGLVDDLGAGADWIVLPDVVCGGIDSLRYSLDWMPRLRERLPDTLLLLATQNGMTPEHVAGHVGPRAGIFVGGDTAWKEASLPMWGELARATGCYLHVGRVNSMRRISLCALAGVDSFDGTSVTKFSSTIHRLDRARRQPALPWGEPL